MSYTNQNPPTREDPSYGQKMYRLGMAIDELRRFYIVGICLCWLIVPLIIWLIRYVKYLIALYDVKQASGNANLNMGVNMILASVLLGLINGPAYSTGGWAAILSIGALVLLFLGYTRLEDWCGDVYQSTQNQNYETMRKGWGEVKIASLLQVIFIGIFMMPPALREISEAIFQEYGPQSNAGVPQAAPQMNTQAYGQPQTPPPAYQPVQPQAPPAPQPPTVQPNGSAFCPYCGGKLTGPDAKFCANCGQKLE